MGFTTWQRAHLAKAHGDDAKAVQLAQMSLAEFSALNDRDCVALVNNLLGEIVFRNKHFGEAARYYQNALDLVRTTNNPAGVAWTALLVGQALLGDGQIERAVPCFVESALLRETMGDPETTLEAVQGLAICMALQEQYVLAAQLFGASSSGRRGDSLILLEPVMAQFLAARERTQAHLGQSQWLAELTIGKLTSPHSLIESVAAFAQLPDTVIR